MPGTASMPTSGCPALDSRCCARSLVNTTRRSQTRIRTSGRSIRTVRSTTEPRGREVKRHRATFAASDLVRATDPHYEWRCLGCAADLVLAPDDPRVCGEFAPKCERCGDWTEPVHRTK